MSAIFFHFFIRAAQGRKAQRNSIVPSILEKCCIVFDSRRGLLLAVLLDELDCFADILFRTVTHFALDGQIVAHAVLRMCMDDVILPKIKK